MRWRTFNSMMESANGLAQEGDTASAVRAMRLLKLLPKG
jgi:hypothetical protein